MQKLKSSFGYAIVLWIVGVFPIIFDVLFRSLLNADSSLNSYEDILIAVCTFIGGLLCLYVADIECDVKIKEHNWKINLKSLFLTVLFAVAYVTSTFGTLRRDDLNSLYGLNERVPWQIFIAAALITPWGEELIYRYSIFSVLRGKEKRLGKTICAVIISSFMFTVMHFNGGLLRIAELLLFGAVSAIIFHLTDNILYSIVFHGVANFVSYSICDIFQTVHFHNIILVFSIPLAVLCFALLISDFTGKKKLFNKDSCL